MAAAAVATPFAGQGEPFPGGSQGDRVANEDVKDPKAKKKFKPLEKMRKFFKGSSKKSTKAKDRGDKARSTGTLNRDGATSEDDDDGGFRRGVPLANTRSISEDSVFNPEQRGDLPVSENLRPAVSMDTGVNNFQKELFGRIKSRAVSISEDEDDSPSPLTTTEAFLGGRLQGNPSQGKSSSRESDRSLTSADGSENEDDLFKTSWQTSVMSTKSPKPRSHSDSTMDSNFDLGVVKRDTQTLSNDAAKHRISVKPKTRRSSSMHNRTQTNREKTTTTPPMPSLHEESPTKSSPPLFTTKGNKTSIQIKAKSTENLVSSLNNTPKEPSKPETVTSPSSSQKTLETTTKKPVTRKASDEDKAPVYSIPMKKVDNKTADKTNVMIGSMKTDSEVKLQRERPKSLMGNVSSQENVSSSDNSEFAQAFNKFKRLSLKKEIEVPTEICSVNKTEKVEPLKEINVNPKIESPKESEPEKKYTDDGKRTVGKLPIPGKDVSATKQISQSKGDVSANSEKTNVTSNTGVSKDSSVKSPSSNSSNVTYVLKKEPLRSPISSKSPDYENIPYLATKPNVPEDSSLKSPSSTISSPEHDYDNLPALEQLPKLDHLKGEKKEEVVVATFGMKKDATTNKLSSPKEEYRLKRQARSKTLPEQPVSVDLLETSAKSNILSKSQTTQRTETYKISDFTNKNKFSRSFNAGKMEGDEKFDTKVETSVSPSTKRLEPKRLSIAGPAESSTSSQPSWISVAKKKQESQEEASKATEQKADKTTHGATIVKGDDKPSTVSKTTPSKESVDKMSTVASRHDKPSTVTTVDKGTPSVSKFGSSFKESEKPSISVSKFGQAKTAGSEDKPLTGSARFGLKGTKVEKEVSKPSQEKKEPMQKPPLKTKPTDIATKSSTLERKSMFEKTDSSSSNVPAWKQSLKKKGTTDISSEPKIEIIEKDQGKSTPKIEEKKPVTQIRSNTGMPEKCADEVKNNRKSAVLDMVKNFQNMQVS